MKKTVFSVKRSNKFCLLLFLVVSGWIFFLVGQELFFPAPPVPVIDVAAELAKIEKAGLSLYPARFYRITGEDAVK